MRPPQMPLILMLATAAALADGGGGGGGAVAVSLHPDAGLDIYQLVAKYGYPLETHEVETADGYILTLHRIPNGVVSPNTNGTKPPILLIHCLMCTSMEWVNTGPERALGFLLADAGYDVWLGNCRGNSMSRKHKFLDPDRNASKFFNYSFHEMGIFDIPAKIDYILNLTGNEQLYYTGFSQGTTVLLIMASEKPEYNRKLRFVSLLAPVAYLKETASPIVKLGQKYELILELLANKLHIYEFLPHYPIFTEAGMALCDDGSPLQELCADVFFVIAGFDSAQLNRTFLPVILSSLPGGSSVMEIKHFVQMSKSGAFRQYDHGPLGNWRAYQSIEPPKYNISRITAPLSLHYGFNDWLSSYKDVEKLAAELPNVASKRMVPYEKFTHFDFLWANDVVTLVYNDVINELKNH